MDEHKSNKSNKSEFSLSINKCPHMMYISVDCSVDQLQNERYIYLSGVYFLQLVINLIEDYSRIWVSHHTTNPVCIVLYTRLGRLILFEILEYDRREIQWAIYCSQEIRAKDVDERIYFQMFCNKNNNRKRKGSY